MRKNFWSTILAIPLIGVLLTLAYYLPPVHDRLAWRVDELQLRVKYALNPPEQVVFVPQAPSATPGPVLPTSTPSITPTPLPTFTPLGPTDTPPPSATPTATPTPLPLQVTLTGIRYQDQHGRWNYCAPANLAMALSFWGWEGTQDVVGPIIKPDPKDKNVMPYEMADYIREYTDLKVFLRAAGDIELLKRFVGSGFPVLIEKGTYLRDITGVRSWMGHYGVVTGYDDEKSIFVIQDSFIGPDTEVSYDLLVSYWRAFNYTYLIVYPADREAEVIALLGRDADEGYNKQHASQKASDEIFALEGIDQYFAWYNRGTSLVAQQDYAGAANAFDQAFAVYPSIPEDERPWRMLWYQTGPYFAYYYTGRYYDVLTLADTTLNSMQSDKNLEESYYWRGMAKAALGDTDGAIEDYRLALTYHPGFSPSVIQLQNLGVEP